MLLTLRTTNTHGNARSTADAVITALSPAAWYRNATGVTSAGGFASQWDDYSGNARHLVQLTGTNQPAYAAGVFTFDGADNYMIVTGGFTLNQPLTAILVIKPNAYTSGDYFFDGNTGNRLLVFQTGVTPSISMYAGGAVAANTNLTIGAEGVLCAVFNGAASSLRVNDTAKTTGDPSGHALNGFTLGAAGGGGATGWSAISVREAILFPSALSDTNASAVITALNNALTVF